MKARKTLKVPYPNLYAVPGVHEKADEFNRVQRGHQNMFETLSSMIAMTLVGGLKYPGGSLILRSVLPRKLLLPHGIRRYVERRQNGPLHQPFGGTQAAGNGRHIFHLCNRMRLHVDDQVDLPLLMLELAMCHCLRFFPSTACGYEVMALWTLITH